MKFYIYSLYVTVLLTIFNSWTMDEIEEIRTAETQSIALLQLPIEIQEKILQKTIEVHLREEVNHIFDIYKLRPHSLTSALKNYFGPPFFGISKINFHYFINNLRSVCFIFKEILNKPTGKSYTLYQLRILLAEYFDSYDILSAIKKQDSFEPQDTPNSILEKILSTSPLQKGRIQESMDMQLATLLIYCKNLNPRTINNEGRTLLHLFVIRRNNEMIKRLLRLNLDVNAKDNKGKTPLHLAISNYHSHHFLKIDATVKQLLAQPEILLHIPDSNGETPLHIAIKQRKLGSVLLLLDHPQTDLNTKYAALKIAQSQIDPNQH